MLDGYQDGTGRRRRAGLLTERGRFLLLLLVAVGLLVLTARLGGCRAFTQETTMAKICQQCPGNVFLVGGECPKCKGGLKRPMAKRRAAEVETKRRTREAEREFSTIGVQPHMVPRMAPRSRNWGRTG